MQLVMVCTSLFPTAMDVTLNNYTLKAAPGNH